MDEAWSLYLEQGTLTRTAIRTIHAFGRLERITAERDRFVAMVARHLHARLPDVPYEAIEAASIAVADQTMGVIVSELHREPSPRRRAALRAAVQRTLEREAARLTALSSARG